MLRLARSNVATSIPRTARSMQPNVNGSLQSVPHRQQSTFEVDNPYSGEVYCAVNVSDDSAALAKVAQAAKVQKDFYSFTSLQDRQHLVERFIRALHADSDRIAQDISGQMGKTFKQSLGEIAGTEERARAMIDIAPQALATEYPPALGQEGVRLSITRDPVGVVLVIAPWNYPLLAATNTVVPAILAGNAVILKQSARTPLCADAFERAFREAGAPEGLFQALHVEHSTVPAVIAQPEVGYVSFTGSVFGGREVYKAVAQSRFIDCTLELGGKDPAYVAADANLDHAISTIVDGGFYNAGQSCCGVERVYVHENHYEEFLSRALPLIEEYTLGDPMADTTSMGPIAQPAGVETIAKQCKEAKEMGARVLCGGEPTTDAQGKGRFFAPTLLADVNHQMSVMREETFGPVIAVQPVRSDVEALELMNDSPYGLTASVFTESNERYEKMAPKMQCGTFFQNRADYLHPLLPWTGVKDTGKGASLSVHGFNGVARMKSRHQKHLH